jgi:hypothetical protein
MGGVVVWAGMRGRVPARASGTGSGCTGICCALTGGSTRSSRRGRAQAWDSATTATTTPGMCCRTCAAPSCWRGCCGGLAYQRVPGTLVVIGPPLLDPNPFDAEPADPIALVPAVLTPLRVQATRQLRHRLPLGMPAGTVRWHTPGLTPAVTACRGERDRPRGQRPWYPPPGAGHRIDRVGGVLVLAATAQELKSWAVAVAQLGDWLLEGMDYTGLNGTDGEVQVFTDYRHRVGAAQLARREVLASPARQQLTAATGLVLRATVRLSRRHGFDAERRFRISALAAQPHSRDLYPVRSRAFL